MIHIKKTLPIFLLLIAFSAIATEYLPRVGGSGGRIKLLQLIEQEGAKRGGFSE